jgi:tight adherence protein B
VAAACLLAGGWLVGGIVAGAVLALAGPTLALGLIRSRRRRYRSELARDAPGVARALADALSAGHSIPGAIVAAAEGAGGAAGHELRVASRAIEHGERTTEVLERLRRRARSRPWDTLVAAILIQREAGGDLAGLLRELADGLQAAERTERDAETATAQARFTAWLVLALPLGAAGLAELTSPGFTLNLLREPLSSWLLGAALTLQAGAALCVRKLARAGGAAR